MISVLTAYKNGLSTAWKDKKMLFWLYGFNLLFAYLMTVPLSVLLTNALDKTTAADKVLQSFDFTTFTTIMDHYGKGVSLGRIIITFGILYLIVNIFFAGGILKTFVEEKKFKLIEFLNGCVIYFKRFLKLALISFLFFVAAVLIYLLISELFSLFTDTSTTEHFPIIAFVIEILILGLLLAIINMLFDYVKIMIVVNDFYAMFRTVKLAIVFVMTNLRKTIGLYFSYLFTVFLFLTIYLFVESFISVSGWLTILIFFLWTQLFVISRIWLRLSFFAGQYSFYHFSEKAISRTTDEM